MSLEIPHEVISASAGSGKTHQLTNRYIELLARGCDPARIVALTFSRKAAGEIFDRILSRLAEAATDGDELDGLNSQLELPPNTGPLTRERLVAMIRTIIAQMTEVQIGTLDSFFARIIRSFPMELGVQGDFEIIDEARMKTEKELVLRRILSSEDNEKSQQLINLLRNSNPGEERKTVFDSLLKRLEDNHQYYLDVPEESRWGNPHLIWPTGCEWLNGGHERPPNEEISRFQERWTGTGFEKFFEKIFTTPKGRPPVLNKLGERLLENAEGLRSGSLSIKDRRKVVQLDKEDCDFFWKFLKSYVAPALFTGMARAQTLYSLLDRYERQYAAQVRTRGRLTFADFLLLLNGQRELSARENPAADQLYIEYRMDGKFDHWMIDEFQDTSRAQWHVLENLIDEVVQRQDSEKTLFYVGDVKQAIYGWRGGDSSLFGRIYRKYRQRIKWRSLARSWRSAPPVIQTVNAVFGNLKGVEGFSDAIVQRWLDEGWKEHQSAEPKQNLPGYAALYRFEKTPSKKAENSAKRHLKALEIVRDLRRRGVQSIGILVRKGDTGQEIADLLQRNAIPVAKEGKVSLVDNPRTASFLALIKIAAHPGDEFAWQHIAMSPLANCLREQGLTRAEIPLAVLAETYAKGFEGALARFMPSAPPELVETTRSFDLLRNRNMDDYIDFIENSERKILSSADAVSIMTIHKAKGLAFDAVILPDLQGSGIFKKDSGLTSDAAPDSSDKWVFELPNKSLCSADETLSKYRTELENENAFQELCLLYVAMTRPRQGLYMLTTAPGKKSKTTYLSTLLNSLLLGKTPSDEGRDEPVWECGERQWSPKREPKQSALKKLEISENPAPPQRRLSRSLPSQHAEQPEDDAGALFTLSGSSADFGTAIHELFQRVAWLDESDPELIAERWMSNSQYPISIKRDVVKEFKRAISSDAVHSALSRPAGAAEVWCERRFEVVLDGSWISGCFDRVVLGRDESGKFSWAEILDYKSGNPEPEKYRSQMDQYRRALARIVALPPSKISTRLLFTESGRLVDISR